MAKQRQSSRRPVITQRRKSLQLARQRTSSRKLHLERLEERRVMAAGLNLVAVLNNSVTLLNSGDTLNVAPRELTLRFAQGQSIDASSINSGSVRVTRAGGDGIFDASGPPVLVSPVADIPVTPGYLAISPDTSREIVMRFAANLPDDLYKVEIVGALRDSLGNSATASTVTFNLELGTKVSAVVPQPIARNNATKAISQSRNSIEVYFDSNELNSADRTNPGFYRLIDTATGQISIPNKVPIAGNTTPAVSYDPTRKMATLRFATDIPAGTYKLEVGVTSENDGATTLARHVGNSMVDVNGAATTIQAFVGDNLTLTQANQGNDVDLYRFDLRSEVTDFNLTVTPGASLDAVARLFRLNPDGTTVTEVGTPINANGAGVAETASSFGLLTPGTYFVGVSSSGNVSYNAATGAGNTGGGSTGAYSINVTFNDGAATNDANSSFATATPLGTLGQSGRNISASILSQRFDIQFPGSGDAPGERNTPFESHLTTIAGRLPDPTGGVETFTYDFQNIYGFSPTGQQLSNAITEPQKQRVRETLELYSRYLGVQFREVSSTSPGVQADITIATGEPRAVAPTVSTGTAPNPNAINGVNGIAGIHNVPANGVVTNTSGITNLLATTNAANITGASGFFVSPTGTPFASTIFITSPGHGLATGAKIHISGVRGNTTANGTWVITVVNADTFTLNGSTANGAYFNPGAAGSPSGTWNKLDLANTVAIMNSLVSWGSSEFGGQYFQTAMHEIGHLLGLGDNFEAAALTIMGTGETPSLAANTQTAEPVFPGDPDIVYGQTVHRPESRDIDLYQFNVTEPGLFRAETIAERLASTSTLNTVLTLYQETLGTTTGSISGVTNGSPILVTSLNHHLATGDRIRISGVGGTTSANGDFTITFIDANSFTLDGSLPSSAFTSGGTWTKFTRTIVARNDDYYGNDSYLELQLNTGRYFVAVTSVGNTEFDPSIADSGFGGRTQGTYTLSMNLRPDAITSMTDTSGTRFDGDADGAPGGQYEFWFQSNTADNTIYVDKLNTAVGQSGLITNPYNNLATALSFASPGKILRIVGNGGADNNLNTLVDNKPYLIGYRNVGLTQPLADGGDFNVPQGVTVMVDAGANFKLRRANLNAGTTPQGLLSRAGGVIQVLGTPLAGESVTFTSYADDSVGGDSDGPSAGAQGGDYGGIVFRDDSDREAAGIFLNTVNFANMKFGGGKVTVDSVEGQFTPIYVDNARPTLSNNTISTSASGAMSASPNSFDDDGMDVFGKFKNVGFNQRRIGPDIHDNTLVGNSINGMFIRIRTLAGNPLDLVDLSTRWDDTDMVHIVSENLVIAGTPGGSTSPGSDRPATIQSDGRLRIDAGMIVKMSAARIETRIGSQFIAEGTVAQPIIFTSLKDDRYGASGTFDTNRDGSASVPVPGDFGGLVFGPASTASIAQSRITFGGGTVPIEGGFDRFNAIEIQQADVRIANSLLQFNDSGASTTTRNGRGTNAAATIFVRGAQPIIVNNTIRDNAGPMISINANALQDLSLNDSGQATGLLNLVAQSGANRGPLIRNNRATNNGVNGMEVRGGTLSTETVWDDTDIAHVLHTEILIPNHQVNSGIRLQSSASESLVIKLSGPNAGFTASGTPLDIDDRIGGTVHVIGQPGHPVILTSISDDTVPAGFAPNGSPLFDTDNSTGSPLVGPEVNNATLIDNDVLTNSVGHFELRPAAGGSVGLQVPGSQTGVTAQGQSLLFANRNLISEFLHYVDFGTGIIDLRNTTVTQPPILVGADLVRSAGSFARNNGEVVNWQVDTTFTNGGTFATNTITFSSLIPLGAIDFVNYYDQGNGITPLNINNEFLLQIGTPGSQPPTIPGQPAPLPVLPGADFRLATINNTERIGFAHGGVYTRNTPGLTNADYLGFAADINPNLQGAIAGGAGSLPGFYTIPGVINTQNLPAIIDPALGPVNGIAEVTSAMAWRVDAAANFATITTFLELIAQNPSAVGSPGDWRGVKLDHFSNDRNVAQVVDVEPSYIAAIGDNNRTPLTAQPLGKLAPNLKSGDDTRRLGFEVDGTIAFDNPADVDVYSFRADSGTEVWIDIDRTSYALDAMVELVTADGTVLVRATDTNPNVTNLFGGNPDAAGLTSFLLPAQSISSTPVSLSFNKDPFNGRDTYSTNQAPLSAPNAVLSRDPILRVVLPTAANGTPLQDAPFFIRVRSQPTNFAGEFGNIVNPGLTSGSYQLQIRLQQKDEKAGSTVKYADIRYATRGIEVLGLPYHSPLTGETVESNEATNNDFTGAQNLGNLLRADSGTISVGGNITADQNGVADVDWYRFDLGFDMLQVINNYTNGFKTWSTVFDLDYGNGLSRANATLAVFDDTGRLIFIGRDSDVEDDQGESTSDLADGSLGKLDPFIGPASLPAGSAANQTRTYYVAVANDRQIPQVLDQTFNSNATDTNVRLEPIEAIFRTATDHMDALNLGRFTGQENGDLAGNAYIDANTGLPKSTLLDPTTLQSLQANVRPFTLADVPLFMVGGGSNPKLFTVNAGTGLIEIDNYANRLSTVNTNSTSDIAFRTDGVLFGYESNFTPNTQNTAGTLAEIDTAAGSSSGGVSDSIPDRPNPPPNPVVPEQITTNQVDALAWGGTVINGIQNSELVYSVRDNNARILVSPATPARDPDGIPNNGDEIPATQDVFVTGVASRLYDANPVTGSAAVVQGQPQQGRLGGEFDFINVSVPANGSTNFGVPGILATFNARVAGTSGNGTTVTINQPQPGTTQISATPANPAANPPTPGSVTITPGTDPTPATGMSDMNTGFSANPAVGGALTFQAVTAGNAGNGITIDFIRDDVTARFQVPPGPTELPITRNPSGTGITITLDSDASDFNADGVQPTTIQQVIDALNAQGFGSELTAGFQGNAFFPIGRPNLGAVATITLAGGSDTGASLQSLINAINNDPNASLVIVASFSGDPATPLASAPGPYPINLVLAGGSNTVGVTEGLSFGSGNFGSSTLIGTTQVDNSGSNILYGVTDQGKFLIDIGGRTVPFTPPVPGQPTPPRPGPAAPLRAVSVALPDPLNPTTPIVPIFSGLTRGPQNLENGRFANMFFASTTNGLLVALDAEGTLQTVFDTDSDGIVDSSYLRTNVGGTTGLAFSPFDFNLWHPTFQRQGDTGHSMNSAPTLMHENFFSGSAANHGVGRGNSGANMSFRFGYENWVNNPGNVSSSYQTYGVVGGNTLGTTGNVELQGNGGQLGVIGADTQRELSINPDYDDNYNMPGGSYGSLQTDKFSLAATKATDKPTFYFDYFLDTEDSNHVIQEPALMRDSARVYIGVPLDNGGVRWDLIATNNDRPDSPGTGAAGLGNEFWDGELPTFQSVSTTALPANARQQVQLLHDNTSAWRQARVDLTQYAGMANLQLRFDFSTAGAMPGLMQYEDQFGNLNHRQRAGAAAGAAGDNDHQGFFVDNFIIGNAERGEMVTNAPVNTNFSPTPTPTNYDATSPVPTEVLTGPYQLEIRRSAEYALSAGGTNSSIVALNAFDTNERLIADKRLGSPIPVEDFETNDFSKLKWSFTDDKPWTIVNLADPLYTGVGGTTGFAAASGVITHGQSSGLEVDLVTGNGVVAFDFAVSSRVGDGLIFYVDGRLTVDTTGAVTAYNGSGGDDTFRTIQVPVSAGRHHFRWTFIKNAADGANPAVLDQAFLDNIIFPTPQVGIGDLYDNVDDHNPANLVARRLPVGSTVAPPSSLPQNFLVDLLPNGLRRTGDENQQRQQGHIQIEQNMVFAASEIGILIDAALRDPVTGNPYPGSLRNLPTLSTDRLVPGVTVTNNIVANYGLVGIQFSGDANQDDAAGLSVPLAAVPFGRLVNNTVYGGATATGTGILVSDNAGPTLLNNIVANAVTGVSVDGSSRNTTVLGVNVFANNNANTNGGTGTGTNAIFLTASDPLFVDADNRNFYLAPNSRAIDSGLDVLADRPTIAAVKSAIGIPQSPILAPTLDAFGQVRGGEPAPDADPSQPPTPGGGENVFVDRGAVERADFDAPSAQVVDPLDNDPAGRDRDDNANDVKIKNELLQRFSVKFSDDGVGIDDVTAGDSRNYILLQDGVQFTDGVEYSFDYNSTTDEAIFNPSSGSWPLNHTYSIQIRNSLSIDPLTGVELGVRDKAGNYLGVNRGSGPFTGQTLFTIFTGILRDFGDAPDSGPGTGFNNYETLVASNGPAHEVVAGFQLGVTNTEESEGQQSANADGDKLASGASTDDGISFLTPLSVGVQSTIRVTAGIPTGMRGYVNGWVDLNRNGSFEDVGERIISNREVFAGANNDITFIFGNSNTLKGSTFARFRLTSADPLSNPVSSIGLEADGEVEDYKVTVAGPPFQNATRKEDVNNDGRVTSIDALLVINFINGFTLLVPPNTAIPLPPRSPEFASPAPTLDPTGGGLPGKGRYIDVNGDGLLTVIDALQVINVLNSPQSPSGEGEGEGESFVMTSAPETSSAASLAIPTVLLASPDIVFETRETVSFASYSDSPSAATQAALADLSFLAGDLHSLTDALGLIEKDELIEASVDAALDESNWDSLLADLAVDGNRSRRNGSTSR